MSPSIFGNFFAGDCQVFALRHQSALFEEASRRWRLWSRAATPPGCGPPPQVEKQNGSCRISRCAARSPRLCRGRRSHCTAGGGRRAAASRDKTPNQWLGRRLGRLGWLGLAINIYCHPSRAGRPDGRAALRCATLSYKWPGLALVCTRIPLPPPTAPGAYLAACLQPLRPDWRRRPGPAWRWAGACGGLRPGRREGAKGCNLPATPFYKSNY